MYANPKNMIQTKYYAVPKSIADALCLTKYRKHDDEGYYLLSSSDVYVYGIDRAIAEGAVVLTPSEAKLRYMINNIGK
jgi:hypothetical protein